MTFGTKLQKLRIEKNMSQKEISNILEVSQTIYGKWESDIFFPTYKNLKKIAAFYLIDIESLADNKKNLDCLQASNVLNKNIRCKFIRKISKLLKKIEKSLVILKNQIDVLEAKKKR